MATQWQGPHYVAILAASALAFGGGYLLAGRSRPPASTPMATNTSNGAEPAGIPGFGNEQAPRGRPDENELIARNAEPVDGGGAPQGAGNSSRAAPAERRAEPREPRNNDKPAPSEPIEDEGYDPGER
jgi:hypothetical protein